jgi:hypothetical protein
VVELEMHSKSEWGREKVDMQFSYKSEDPAWRTPVASARHWVLHNIASTKNKKLVGNSLLSCGVTC